MELHSIEVIIRALNAESVQYVVVGGLAVNAHGYERFTHDVDLVIGLEEENILRGLRALLGIGYAPSIPVTPEQFADPALRETWRRDKNMLVLKLWSDIHRRTPIDVFVYEPFDFKAEYATARRIAIADDVSSPFVTLESLLAMKRSAGRPQDLADIAALEEVAKISESSRNEPS